MTKVQSVNRKTSFLFVGDVSAHDEEWLGFSTINLHGRAARDFVSSSGCEQMVSEPTHIEGRVTDISDIVGVRVGSPVGTSDHSAVFIDIVLKQPIPHLVCRQEVYLKNPVGWLEKM